MIHKPADYGLNSEVVSFSSVDGIALKAWWIPAQPADESTTEPAPTSAQAQPTTPTVNVVMAHGRDMNRSGMLPRAAFLVRRGYNVLDVDLRNHGESAGNYLTPGSREALDILAGVGYVRSRGERGPIVAFGYSYGAVAALHAAAQCADVAAVVADSAFISPDDVLKNVAHEKSIPLQFRILLQFARLPLLDRSSDLMFRLRTGVRIDRDKASALAAVRRVQQPILSISGDKDWLAPTENTRQMYQEARTTHKQLVVIPGASHNTTSSGATRPLYEFSVLDFLAQNIGRRASAGAACIPDPY
jgi:pimeloyl-ACP methyl ester carboxylesterase